MNYLTQRLSLITEEVHMAAKYLAIRGLRGVDGDPLPDAMTGAAVDHINENKQYFRGLVAFYAAAQATEEAR